MELVGQDAAQRALSRPGGGAVLIVGPDGVGRFGLALRAARAVLGDDPRIDTLQHADLGVLDPDEGIAGVRTAVERLSRRPAEGPRQVLILRDLDRMSDAAHNALLKTLEEPPADAALFALAESVQKVSETIVSRCRIVRARRLTDEETATVLRGLGLPEDLAKDADGSPGRAVYLHEQEVGESATKLLHVLRGAVSDPLGEVDPLVRKRTDEKSADLRRRLEAVLRVVATRLRRELPATEEPLRRVVGALGSLAANANPAIVFSALALNPWTKR